MNIILNRLHDNGTSTTGELLIDELRFVTIEDTYHKVKVYGKTRIPAGTYEIKLRTWGRFHNIYMRTMPGHKGMLWLQDVPGFEDILIHRGNTAADSSGCILVGMQVEGEDWISESTVAYIQMYKKVIKAFEAGERVFIIINDPK